MIRRIENRKDRTADNLDTVLQGDPDHFSEPVRVGEFVIVEHGDKIRRRCRTASQDEGLIVSVGMAAARLDELAERETEIRSNLVRNRGAGTRLCVVVDDDDAQTAGVVQSLDVSQQLPQPRRTAERRHAKAHGGCRTFGHGDRKSTRLNSSH
jgi:hypothetical protein